ncbi:MAG TPA: alcohol dehydrogenase catalytic domain-containing protein, partial [Cyclobacteriaceae bacterium]|nr:alcohol dehydrogenase catalytic domain-containing protein [Cyclobacteriaceae bacterium]
MKTLAQLTGMKAWSLKRTCNLNVEQQPLELIEMAIPSIGKRDILVRISCCGVCHTELDEIEGRLPARLPVVPGHQVVGIVERIGEDCTLFKLGDRVGISWIFSACGHCELCNTGRENLCSDFRATGKDANGGYAEFIRVHEDFACSIPHSITDTQAAPMFCAGAIGYRALKLTTIHDGQSLGLSGFGASGHLVLKMAKHLLPKSEVFVFSRTPQDRSFAESLGATWTGTFDQQPPQLLDAIIDTTPAWLPITRSLAALKPGGRLVVNAIRKESADIAALGSLSYEKH